PLVTSSPVATERRLLTRRSKAARAPLGARIKENRWSYVYIAPFVILVSVFTIYPIIASLGYTLYQWNGIGRPTAYVGLDNFRQVIHNDIFWRSFGHTFLYTAVLVPVQLFLALVLALVLNNRKLRFSTFYRSVYFIPAVISPAIIAVVFQLLFSNFGATISDALMKVHIIDSPVDWLGDPHVVLWLIIAIGIWNTLGYNLVYFLAGLQTIPEELYEAAVIDGANGRRKFWHVTIPGLREIGLIIVFLAVLGSLQVFDLVQVLTGGGPYYASSVVNTYIYQQAFGGGLTAGGGGGAAAVQPNVGFASAASFFYGMILLVLTGAQACALYYARKRRAAIRTEA
ncbi:MAG TPA: sugar ABC transporter permease, partial [Mycobacteriales bacterium]|nr:sugar ABC transporter permease [Mycobacteriales bacterium]